MRMVYWGQSASSGCPPSMEGCNSQSSTLRIRKEASECISHRTRQPTRSFSSSCSSASRWRRRRQQQTRKQTTPQPVRTLPAALAAGPTTPSWPAFLSSGNSSWVRSIQSSPRYIVGVRDSENLRGESRHQTRLGPTWKNSCSTKEEWYCTYYRAALVIVNPYLPEAIKLYFKLKGNYYALYQE